LNKELGHSAKNDLSMEVLRDFCTRETFLRSLPAAGLHLTDTLWYLDETLKSLYTIKNIGQNVRLRGFDADWGHSAFLGVCTDFLSA
jgi:hypothetical protein